MRTDYTAELAKMMKTPEDALRAARLPEEKINDIFLRARSAKRKGAVFALLSLGLFIGSGLLANYARGHADRLVSLMFLGSMASLTAVFLMTGPSKITAEATTAMQRRLVDLDQHCQN